MPTACIKVMSLVYSDPSCIFHLVVLAHLFRCISRCNILRCYRPICHVNHTIHLLVICTLERKVSGQSLDRLSHFGLLTVEIRSSELLIKSLFTHISLALHLTWLLQIESSANFRSSRCIYLRSKLLLGLQSIGSSWRELRLSTLDLRLFWSRQSIVFLVGSSIALVFEVRDCGRWDLGFTLVKVYLVYLA